MAAMGEGIMNLKKKNDSPPTSIKVLPVNLVIHTGQIQPIATVSVASQPAANLPIMRDGFITETGVMPSPLHW